MRLLLSLVFAAAMVACGSETGGSSAGQAMAQIEGTVFYRERIALPPHAVVEIQLEDVSRPDALATVMATVTLNSKSGPPYAFSIDYDPTQIDSRMTYALRATIRVDDKLMFTTMDYTDPFSGNPVSVLVRRVPTSP
jgi:putative lipoprotein